jgi:AcrR family transcriptional regulator
MIFRPFRLRGHEAMSVTNKGESSPRPPGRPRDPEADRAILDAALQCFIDDGYEGMSIESVAARAGVGKTTIYRRWPSKRELIVAAIETLFGDLRVPDTGDVRADLTSLMHHAHVFLTKTKAGEVLPRMVAELAAGTPLGRTYLEKVMRPRLQGIVEALEAAKRRGELRADLDDHLALASIIGSMMFLRITRTLPKTKGDLPDRLITQLIEGMRT